MNENKNLRYVTLTGADDTVNPYDLIEISDKYPNVEWGILIGSKDNWHRFPSYEWIEAINELYMKSMANFSLHICGGHLNKILKGEPLDDKYILPAFGRCQLNFHGEKLSESLVENISNAFHEMHGRWNPEIIFQLDGANENYFQDYIGKKSGLFDLSHGTGVLPEEWKINDSEHSIGYAGGLGPENVKAQYDIIEKLTDKPFWIDMETKLYTGFQFDLDKCKDVLKQIYGY